jgi:hypothetical protein
MRDEAPERGGVAPNAADILGGNRMVVSRTRAKDPST